MTDTAYRYARAALAGEPVILVKELQPGYVTERAIPFAGRQLSTGQYRDCDITVTGFWQETTNRPRPCWINQPGTDYPLHAFHGQRAVAVQSVSNPDMCWVYFADGTTRYSARRLLSWLDVAITTAPDYVFKD